MNDRNLSDLVAERVMGWHKPGEGHWPWVDRDGIRKGLNASFAVDSSLAMDAAVEVLNGQRRRRSVCRAICIELDDDITNRFRGALWWRNSEQEITVTSAVGSTIARALCFAALRAAGVEIQDDTAEAAERQGE